MRGRTTRTTILAASAAAFALLWSLIEYDASMGAAPTSTPTTGATASPANDSDALSLRETRPMLQETLADWSFQGGDEGWRCFKHCLIAAEDGFLAVRGTDGSPAILHRVDDLGGRLDFTIRARTTQRGECRVSWVTAESPRIEIEKSKSFDVNADGEWHDYTIAVRAPGRLVSLLFEFAPNRGKIDLERFIVTRHRRHPLGVDRIVNEGDKMRFTLSNVGGEKVPFETADGRIELAPNGRTEVTAPIQGDGVLEPVVLRARSEKLPDVVAPAFVYHPDAETDWTTRKLGDYELQVANDGRVARIRLDGHDVALLAPIVHVDGAIPDFTLKESGDQIVLESSDVRVELTPGDAKPFQTLGVKIESSKPCEGPVVRAVGDLRAGLMAGLEFLGPLESSSTDVDIETTEHNRYLPDPTDVTMPLMAFETDRATTALTWDDMQRQPSFSAPNVFDAASDHRMALRGETIEAVIAIGPAPLHEAIHWAVARRGLPDPPSAPRSPEEQAALSLRAFEGPLSGEGGWGYAAEKRWPRKPLADIVSTMWRLTNQIPKTTGLTPGGSIITNDSIYFVTDQVYSWRVAKSQQIDRIAKLQREDGSFAYSGRFLDSLDVEHLRKAELPTDTTAGYCARYALTLAEFARKTGDEKALASARRVLDFTQRFRVPRGGMHWDVPIHAPDLLAAAQLAWANARVYELTGEEIYRSEARRWALCGLPFVYQWSDRPIMLYTTPPSFGATERRSPVWIGAPAPWIGTAYAYALTIVAEHDDSLNWRRIAAGILHAAEQLQYPDGDYAGCVPDYFDLRTQQRRSWKLNPSSLVSLRRDLDDQPNGIVVVTNDLHRVAGPFPMKLDGDKVQVQSRPGAVYQVLIDGARILDVRAQGDDVLTIE